MKEKLIRQTKEALVKCLLEGDLTFCSQSDKLESSRVCLGQIKLFVAQRSIVKLQQQILDADAKQSNTMSTIVDTEVDRGIKSCSQIVAPTIYIEKSEEKQKKSLRKW